MIELEYAEVSWFINAHCKLQCSYCHPEFKNGGLDKTLDQYLTVIEKLQQTRYKHHSKILWKIGGGEPLHFPNLSSILKKMRERPCIIRLDTSGDNSYFSAYGILNLIDRLKLTYHYWQNDDIVGFILEQCLEKNIGVSIIVPLAPGQIHESREKVEHFRQRGYVCNEQVLYDRDGKLHHGYSNIDLNRIHHRPDDEIIEPVVPKYIDLSVVNNTDPIYTGMPCYAGVDWLHINPKGFASYSHCGGRSEHYNVFNPDWQPPDNHFPCNVIQCKNEKDRRTIRIVGS